MQNRVQRFFLGVHRFAPLPATKTEMDWLDIVFTRWMSMLRYVGRLAVMEETRLPKKVLRWDILIGSKGWMRDVIDICKELDIPSPVGPMQSLYVYDTEPLMRRALVKNREEWMLAANGMPKLCTYVLIKDFMNVGTMVHQNLPRNQRSVLSKFLCGILPIEIETGRFRNIKRELRFCKMCNSNTAIEDEIHFLHACPRLKEVRDEHLKPLREGFEGDADKDHVGFTRFLLSENRISSFAKALETMVMYRRDLLLK